MNKYIVISTLLALGAVACSGEGEAPATEAVPQAASGPTDPSTAGGGGSTNFGTVTLAAGFTEPHIVEGQSGGSIDAATLNPDCVGNVDDTPDHALELAAPMAGLRIFAAAEQDITLVVQQPDGTYLCNDDSDGTNPLVTAENFPAGTYRIWIGNYDASAGAASYRLAFSTATDASPAQLTQ